MPFLRQLGMVLRAILAQQWWAAALVFCLILPLLTSSRLFNGSEPIGELSIIEKPSVPASDGSDVLPPGRLATTRDWFGVGVGVGRWPDSDWEILDRLPALERLWLHGPWLTAEAWQSIGEHPTLELLSLRSVMCIPGDGGRFARQCRDALARLPRLRSLELHRLSSREEDSDHGFLLPTLPALETCQLGSANLEANLCTLADGSPALRTLAVATGGDTPLTPAMVASLRRMPHLRAVYVVARNERNMIEIDEPSTRRQVADLAVALPRIRVRPGCCASNLDDQVFWAALAWPLSVSCLFWFGAGTLLATPLGWMLPTRLAAHLFWPITVSIVACVAFVVLCLQLGVNWLPAVALAASAVAFGSLGIPNGFWVILAMTNGIRIVVSQYRIERWLIDGEPLLATGLLTAATAVIAMRLRRLAENPRILAEQGREVPFALATHASHTQPREQQRWQWPSIIRGLSEGGVIDRQIAKQPPASISTAAGFATMLRRPQSRLHVLVVAVLAVAIPQAILGSGIRDREEPSPPAILHMLAMIPATMFFLALLAGGWGQRRKAAAVDFLRPVSRQAYWQGLRRATARDLVVPATVVAYGLVVFVSCEARGQWLPWIPAILGFIGFVALAQAVLMAAATSRRLFTVLVVAVCVCAAYFTMFALTPVAIVIDDVHGKLVWRRLDPMMIAAAVLVAGLVIRAAVLWKLEDREIG
jgi:hypothetical protein